MPRAGRRPGRSDTRNEILRAARHRFAARGYQSTSLRSIAADAGVDPALIHHYFDSKQRLFLATVAIPVPIDEILAGLVAGGRDGLGERMLATLLSIWDSDVQPNLVAALRSALADPEMGRVFGEFLDLELVGRTLAALGVPPAEATRRGALIASQVLGVLIGRYVLRLPALTSLTSVELVAWVGPTLQHYLDGNREEGAR